MESEHVLHTSGAVPEELIKSLMEAMRAGSFEKSEKLVDGIIKGGYPATQVRRFVQASRVSNPCPTAAVSRVKAAVRKTLCGPRG